jgi:membrane-bound inhibitor of C-type lysozyme
MEAGSFLSEIAEIPHKGVFSICGDRKLTVEKTNKRHISLLRTEPNEGKLDESYSQK